MKRVFKISLIVLSCLFLVILIGGIIGWSYLSSQFFTFENDFREKRDFKELAIDGYKFLDRNENGQLDVYEDARQPIGDRVNDVLQQMTLAEKIHLIKGSGIASAVGMNEPGEGVPGAVGTIVPTPRLGIPTVYLSDGPAGLRIEPTRPDEDRTYYCTAFPIATLLASTWNKALVYEVGNAMGTEAREYGIDVILGPGLNIHRHPLCGRNFEYFSEDPLLSGYIGAAYVNGIESNGIGTSVKHFAANNQETDRDVNNVIISERALREIYLKGFEIVVREAQPWTIMSSYNKVNGTYTSESSYLLTDVLRNEWGFEGLVMSDWFGGRNAAAQVSAGNDLLEPGTKRQWDALIDASTSGELSAEAIDRAAGRILTLVFKSGNFQQAPFGNNPDLDAHAEITRQSAAEGMVLLKNNQALPLEGGKNVALLGITSYDFIAGGTGSGDVNEAYTISLEEGLKNAGFTVNAVAKDIYLKHKKANEEEFVKPAGFAAMFEPYFPPEMTFTDDELRRIAENSDVGILTIGRNAGEGGDRVETDDFLLRTSERQMIAQASEAFQAVGKKLVVVLNIGGVIETASWKNQPDAILLAWQGGQEGGNSVADLIGGKVSPSGKLPMTFPVHLSDHAANDNFPLDGQRHSMLGVINDMMLGRKEETPDAEKVVNKDFTRYEEGIFVGYRHFDKADLEVSYPFGFGLSYTEFQYADSEVWQEGDTIKVSAIVHNTGQWSGKEVVEVFFAKPDSGIERPLQELKAFAKTSTLEPGQSQDISLSIPISDLQYWNEKSQKWDLEPGVYDVKLGASSRDIRLVEQIELSGVQVP